MVADGINWWWVDHCSADEGPQIDVGDRPERVVAAVLASASANLVIGSPLWPGTHRRVVGPGRALR